MYVLHASICGRVYMCMHVYIFVFMCVVYTHIPIYKYFLALFVEKDKKP